MKPDVKALRLRIDKAVQRISGGYAPMRIPADPSDADLVLTDCRALCDRVEALEAALSVALGLYTNTEAESETGYAQYRMACDILESE